MSKKIRKQRRVRYTNKAGVTRLVSQKQRAYYKSATKAGKQRTAFKKSVGKIAGGKSFKKLGAVVSNKALQRGTLNIKTKGKKSVKFSASAFGIKNSTLGEVFENFDRRRISGDTPTYSSKVFRKSLIDSYDTNFERKVSERSEFFDCLKPTAKRKFLDSARLDLAKVQSNRYLFILNGKIVYEDDLDEQQLDELDETLNKDASQNLSKKDLETYLARQTLKNIEKYATKQDFKTTGKCANVGNFKRELDRAKQELPVEDIIGSTPTQHKLLIANNLITKHEQKLQKKLNLSKKDFAFVPDILINPLIKERFIDGSWQGGYWIGVSNAIGNESIGEDIRLAVRTLESLNDAKDFSLFRNSPDLLKNPLALKNARLEGMIIEYKRIRELLKKGKK